MAWAAAIFSSAVNPPSSPPGRDSIPEVGAGVAAGSVSSCAAGLSVGAGSAEAAGAGLADGKGVVWGVEPGRLQRNGGRGGFLHRPPLQPRSTAAIPERRRQDDQHRQYADDLSPGQLHFFSPSSHGV